MTYALTALSPKSTWGYRMLNVTNLRSGYGEIGVLKDITFDVKDEIFAVLGSNGAGKTTLLKTLALLLPATRGQITFQDKDITQLPAHLAPAHGLAYVPQEGNVFPALSVLENLRIGGRTGSLPMEQKLDEVFALFPRLKERTRQQAGSLSGGEGQMLAVGRAMMQEPKLMLLDEPSAGLSPKFVDILFESITEARKTRGMTIVLAEQNAVKALEIADRVLVLSLGEVHLLKDRRGVEIKDITEAYHI